MDAKTTERLVSKSRVLEDNEGTLIVSTYGHIATISYMPTGFTPETIPTASLTTRNDRTVITRVNDLIDKAAFANGHTDEECHAAIAELGMILDSAYCHLLPTAILSAFERMANPLAAVKVG